MISYNSTWPSSGIIAIVDPDPCIESLPDKVLRLLLSVGNNNADNINMDEKTSIWGEAYP